MRYLQSASAFQSIRDKSFNEGIIKRMSNRINKIVVRENDQDSVKLDPAFYVQQVYNQFIENLGEEIKVDFKPQDIINEVLEISERYQSIQDYTVKDAIDVFNLSHPQLLNLSIGSDDMNVSSSLLDKDELSGSSSDGEFEDEDIILGVWSWNING